MNYLKIVLFFIGVSVFSMSSSAQYVSREIPPATVDELDSQAYLGRWYQMYASLTPNSTYERNGYCVTGDYYAVEGQEDEGRAPIAFSLVNSMTIDSPTGKLSQISGAAFGTPSPGKFVVKFNKSPNPGNYWVVAVGEPREGETQYPWAVVSSPLLYNLFILARDVEQFRTEYKDEVLDLVTKLGFTRTYNRPLETYQGEACKYADFPAPPDSIPESPFRPH